MQHRGCQRRGRWRVRGEPAYLFRVKIWESRRRRQPVCHGVGVGSGLTAAMGRVLAMVPAQPGRTHQ